VSTPGDPVPQRIGDAERDRAVELLREHMAQGRLDQVEFDDRLSTALSAKTAGELDPLFSDLPGPRPTGVIEPSPAFQAPPWQARPASSHAAVPHLSAPVPEKVAYNPALTALTAVMWPVTILLITFVLPGSWGNFWWLVFVPMVISSMLGKNHSDRREHERQRIEREQRRLDERRRAIGD
jgi:hypothetical protein